MTLFLNDQQMIYLYKLIEPLVHAYPEDALLHEIHRVVTYTLDCEIRRRMRSQSRDKLSKDLLAVRLPEILEKLEKERKPPLSDLL